jgi:hypothetical protein
MGESSAKPTTGATPPMALGCTAATAAMTSWSPSRARAAICAHRAPRAAGRPLRCRGVCAPVRQLPQQSCALTRAGDQRRVQRRRGRRGGLPPRRSTWNAGTSKLFKQRCATAACAGSTATGTSMMTRSTSWTVQTTPGAGRSPPQLEFGFDQTPATDDWPEMDQTAGQIGDCECDPLTAGLERAAASAVWRMGVCVREGAESALRGAETASRLGDRGGLAGGMVLCFSFNSIQEAPAVASRGHRGINVLGRLCGSRHLTSSIFSVEALPLACSRAK